MAGLPPLLGFVGKEAAFTAFLDGGLESRTWALLTLLGLVLGSVLTVAYTARFLWGAFGSGGAVRRCAAGEPKPAHLHLPGPAFLAAPVLLAALCLLAGPFSYLLEPLVAPYADTLPLVAEEAEELKIWHGLQPALLLSLVTVLGGLALFTGRDAVARLQRRIAVDASADEGYWHTMRGLDRVAQTSTRSTQRGSLPTYLGVILTVLVALPGSVLVFRAPWPDAVRPWDTPVQAVVGVVILGAAALAVRIRQRLSAVLVVGVTGYGVGVLFALQGAPDLALTQFLVETLTLVTFVLVLRKLPKDISDRHRAKERTARGVIALAVGALMAGVGVVALGARTATPVSVDFPEQAYSFGGGENIVNVTLVDIRAWDTLLEISLLVVVATGVASLVFIRQRNRRGRPGLRRRRARTPGPPRAARPWLAASVTLSPQRRSVILEVVTRVLFHSIVVLSVYLLFSGHNVPGGGFAGGLSPGWRSCCATWPAAATSSARRHPSTPASCSGSGLLLAGTTGIAGLLLGVDALQTTILERTVPVLGDVKLVTSLFFDMGVYLIVVGLVLDVLRSLGAQIDADDEHGDDDPDPAEGQALATTAGGGR